MKKVNERFFSVKIKVKGEGNYREMEKKANKAARATYPGRTLCSYGIEKHGEKELTYKYSFEY